MALTSFAFRRDVDGVCFVLKTKTFVPVRAKMWSKIYIYFCAAALLQFQIQVVVLMFDAAPSGPLFSFVRREDSDKNYRVFWPSSLSGIYDCHETLHVGQ